MTLWGYCHLVRDSQCRDEGPARAEVVLRTTPCARVTQACAADPDLVFDFAVHLGAISHATHDAPSEWTAAVMVRETIRLLLINYWSHG